MSRGYIVVCVPLTERSGQIKITGHVLDVHRNISDHDTLIECPKPTFRDTADWIEFNGNLYKITGNASESIPSKRVTIRNRDKPWFNN